METRRSGRTTKLIAETIVNFLNNGRARFIDHNRENGTAPSMAHYKAISLRIKRTMTELFGGVSPFNMEILPNGQGIEITSKKL